VNIDVEELRDWWLTKATRDIDAMLPKAHEYSASDLQVIGSGLVPHLPPTLQIEAAIGFYLLGKAARITGSLMEGKTPDVDSWDDASVYAMMGRRARETGGWPGGPVPGREGTTEPREAPGGPPVPPRGFRAPERPPVAYVAHPLDNGTLGPLVYDVKQVLKGLGLTWYDPGLAWTLGEGQDHQTVHDANLAVLERCDLMVVVADPDTFSAGTMIEATDRGRYSPGTVIVYGPTLRDSVSMAAEGWTLTRTNGELAHAIAEITHRGGSTK
jgi:hypothetical protein